MIRIKDLVKSKLIQDCERENRMYLEVGDRRYIFDDGKYVGWYKH